MDAERDQYIHSVNLNIHTDFPYLVLDVVNDESYPRNPGFQVMHWHEDLQFIYVLEGAVEVRTLADAVEAQAGEGLFINKNVVHYVGRRGPCHYNSFLFPEYFLEFYAGSPAKAFVEDAVENAQLPFIRFAQRKGWQGEVLALLRQLARLEGERTEYYPYEVLVRLSSLWLLLRKNMSVPPKKKESTLELRMQKMLRYIEEHYAEELALADLAASASVSKSECARCFKLSLGTTPFRYLMEFRLSRAARLLKTTDEPVGNIAAAVGFHELSHFGKCFREKTGYSPRAYRELTGRARPQDDSEKRG